jgi:hypothetical protein
MGMIEVGGYRWNNSSLRIYMVGIIVVGEGWSLEDRGAG